MEFVIQFLMLAGACTGRDGRHRRRGPRHTALDARLLLLLKLLTAMPAGHTWM